MQVLSAKILRSIEISGASVALLNVLNEFGGIMNPSTFMQVCRAICTEEQIRYHPETIGTLCAAAWLRKWDKVVADATTE